MSRVFIILITVICFKLWRMAVNRLLYCIITGRKRSLGQGYIFRSVCQEFCPQGDVSVSVLGGGVPVRGGGLCPGRVSPSGGSLSGGVSIPGGSLSRAFSVWGISVWGPLSRGVSIPGGSLSQGGLCPWGLSRGDPPYGNERVVRILP